MVARLRAAGCVWAEDEAALLVEAAGSPSELTALVERRAGGEPLEQVLGWAELCGIRFAVRPGVFLPRRRTEALVALALGLARPRPVVLDLCCGSGALGMVLHRRLAGVELHAADIDEEAVSCARTNIAGAGSVYLGDLFDPLPMLLRGRVDVLVCNVPYVPTTEIALLPAEAREYEPLATLDGGPDGLTVLRRVAGQAPGWLAPGGSLLSETSERQATEAVAVFAGAGLVARSVHDEELGATVVIGTLPTQDAIDVTGPAHGEVHDPPRASGTGALGRSGRSARPC